MSCCEGNAAHKVCDMLRFLMMAGSTLCSPRCALTTQNGFGSARGMSLVSASVLLESCKLEAQLTGVFCRCGSGSERTVGLGVSTPRSLMLPPTDPSATCLTSWLNNDSTRNRRSASWPLLSGAPASCWPVSSGNSCETQWPPRRRQAIHISSVGSVNSHLTFLRLHSVDH